jgi:type IV secretion system protein VirD4
VSKVKLLKRGEMLRVERETMAAAVAAQGASFEARVRCLDEVYEQNIAPQATVFLDLSTTHRQKVSALRHKNVVVERYVFCGVQRSLASMDARERAYLKTLEIINSYWQGTHLPYAHWRAGLIWGDGKGTQVNAQWLGLDAGEVASPVAAAMRRANLGLEQTISAINAEIPRILSRPEIDPLLRGRLEEFVGQVSPNTGAGSWLTGAQIAGSPFAPLGSFALHIGTLTDGTPLTYSGEGSIVTIAPPGSGKTQCNVFPNLLRWAGPAVVLDISGDIYEHTAAWRAQHVGPVFKFSPLEPESSHHYNPLDFVRHDPDYLWEDARLLAEMMVVPTLSSDPFWENEARTVVTAAISHVCYANPPGDRPMHAVLDILFGGSAWDDMILGLRMAVDVRVMTQHANSLSSMNEKTLSSVLQTARSSLGAWTGQRIARSTAKSDWTPIDLRNGTNPTIYIYIRPNEVEAYLSLLRVFIGQHIRTLTGGPVPPHGSPPILFMLDELPRLRNMPPVDEALNIGRKYGLRLWMFAQSVGQLKTAYENADGMLGSCAVRIYMNPTGADGLADRIAEELGYVESLRDNSRRRLVEPAELTGPGFTEQQIVLANGSKPARVSKDFAFRSAELAQRMSLPAPVIQ